MGFVPTTGPATVTPAAAPRDGRVLFTGSGRELTLPIRAAIPLLCRAGPDAHPTVALLAGAVLLGLRQVAAGRFEPDPERRHWCPVAESADDLDRITRLAQAHLPDDEHTAATAVRTMLAAVVDTMPRARPDPAAPPKAAKPSFAERLRGRLTATDQSDDLASLVTLSLRVEAAEEELVAGSVRIIPQVHDERDPSRFCDVASLWTGPVPGFSERARIHAGIALRLAAEAWPPLDRLLDAPVPTMLILDTDDLVGLLDHGVAALREHGIDVLWPRSLGRDLVAEAALDHVPRMPTEDLLVDGLFGADQVFAFNWRIALHGQPLSDAEMARLTAATGPILKLRDNWMIVDPALARKAKKRLIRTVTPTQALAATLTGVVDVEDTETKVVVGASLLAVRERLRAAPREQVPVPEGLRATLRAYQRDGLSWLAGLTGLGLGGCLADDMGLGKTVTLIALHLHRVANGGPTLVVCPASLLGNWTAEINRFAPGVLVRRFHGTSRSLEGLDGPAGAIVLTTYGTVRTDAATLAAVDWDLVVADEAHHVKNSLSRTARALRTVPAAARVALTGTPVENDLTELWSILDWAVPGLLGSRGAFRKVWAGPIESGRDPALTARFAELIEPFLLRRRKADPGIAPELPAKTETDHPLSLTTEQVVLYEAFVRETMDRIESADPAARRGLILRLLTGLKQICNHPAQFLKQSAPRIAGRSEKIDLLDELLPTILAEDGGLLVFSQYVAMAQLVSTHLTRRTVPHQFLHGGTPVRERDAMVARFQDGAVPVFLLSLKAGGTGLNLTRADHVLHLDRWWNPAVEDQATDRAYRIGQTRAVQVHRAIMRGTVEERIAELLAHKRSLADAVLTRGEAALTELSDAELRDLVAWRPEPGTR